MSGAARPLRIAIIYPDAFSIWHFHRPLLRALVARGHDVTAVSAYDPYADRFQGIGVRHIAVPLARYTSPSSDLAFCRVIYRLCRAHRFDLVHTFTIKPNTFGAIAARLAGTRRVIATAEGLGYAFRDSVGVRGWFMRHVATILYRLGALASDRFWFVNPDDRDMFVSRHVVPASKAFLTISAGVDLEEYYPGVVPESELADLRRELDISPDTLVISMVVARTIWAKGIAQFFEAAAVVSRRAPAVKFLLVGPSDPDSPDAVPEAYLHGGKATNTVEWLGFRNDIKTIYAASSIVVLPSYYREGVPNVLLEAMALGKPVIATDSVGCREVVDHGRNGYLVPPRDAMALAETMLALVASPDKRKAFGVESRRRTEQEFDKTLIINRVINELYRFDNNG